jgi:hypothetical protein
VLSRRAHVVPPYSNRGLAQVSETEPLQIAAERSIPFLSISVAHVPSPYHHIETRQRHCHMSAAIPDVAISVAHHVLESNMDGPHSSGTLAHVIPTADMRRVYSLHELTAGVPIGHVSRSHRRVPTTGAVPSNSSNTPSKRPTGSSNHPCTAAGRGMSRLW